MQPAIRAGSSQEQPGINGVIKRYAACPQTRGEGCRQYRRKILRVLNSDSDNGTVSDDGGRGYRPIVERYCKNNGGCDHVANLFAKQFHSAGK